MQKVILDVDTGTDDAIAMMTALLSPELEVLGVCSVNGNRGIDFTTENTLRVVEYLGLPVSYTHLTTRPGLLPDLLRPAEWDETFKAVPAQWRSLWLTLDASLLEPGCAAMELELVDPDGCQLAVFSLSVQILQQALPPQTLLQTQWFHADCLADYYRVPVFRCV